MPATVPLEDAQSRLKELIESLPPGDEVVITEGERPLARLVRERTTGSPDRPPPGLGKGSIIFMAPDFDDPLDEFKEYTE